MDNNLLSGALGQLGGHLLNSAIGQLKPSPLKEVLTYLSPVQNSTRSGSVADIAKNVILSGIQNRAGPIAMTVVKSLVEATSKTESSLDLSRTHMSQAVPQKRLGQSVPLKKSNCAVVKKVANSSTSSIKPCNDVRTARVSQNVPSSSQRPSSSSSRAVPKPKADSFEKCAELKVESMQPWKHCLMISKSAMSWSATHLEKSVRQTIQVKLNSEQKMKLVIKTRMNKSFKIVGVDGSSLQELVMNLTPRKIYDVTVVFNPKSLGLCHSQLVFQIDQSDRHLKVQLTGQGGCAVLKFDRSVVNPCGREMMVTVKSVENETQRSDFKITNEGSSPGFVFICTKEAGPLLMVHPRSVVIKPKSSQNFMILLDNGFRGSPLFTIFTGEYTDLVRCIQCLDEKSHKPNLNETVNNLITAFRNPEPPTIRMEEATNYYTNFKYLTRTMGIFMANGKK